MPLIMDDMKVRMLIPDLQKTSYALASVVGIDLFVCARIQSFMNEDEEIKKDRKNLSNHIESMDGCIQAIKYLGNSYESRDRKCSEYNWEKHVDRFIRANKDLIDEPYLSRDIEMIMNMYEDYELPNYM